MIRADRYGAKRGCAVMAWFAALSLHGACMAASNVECDMAAAKRAFAKCAACHQIESDINSAGPTLKNIVGRKSADIDGFRYSRALRELNMVWTTENLDAFIAAPQKIAPGTSMAFSGVADVEDRKLLLCYMQEMSTSSDE